MGRSQGGQGGGEVVADVIIYLSFLNLELHVKTICPRPPFRRYQEAFRQDHLAKDHGIVPVQEPILPPNSRSHQNYTIHLC